MADGVQLAGQSVAGSRGDHSQGHLTEGQGRRDFINRPVTAPGDEQPCAGGNGRRRELPGMPRTLGDEDVGAISESFDRGGGDERAR